MTERPSRRGTAEPPADAVETLLRVRYAETDQMGVAHHANYLIWFELARSEFCRARGIAYGQMELKGLFLPVVEVRCRYKQPAHYDDLLQVSAAVLECTRRTLRIGYTVRRDGLVLAEAETLQVLVDSAGRPCAFPPEIAVLFARADG